MILRSGLILRMKFAKLHPDILIAPINGAFGNMNDEQATDFCEIIMPKLMIPCHFWNFAEHGENPGGVCRMYEITPSTTKF